MLKKSNKLKLIKALSFGTEQTENYILHGDNHIILQELLETEIKGKVSCVYIDPPYNNNERYFHYADDFGHDKWISDLTDRISLLFELLSKDGSLWISIDDTEVHYLKVAIDNLLGRNKFITTIVWQHRTTRENRVAFSNNHEYILVYAKNPSIFSNKRNLVPLTEEVKSRYKNPDNDPRGPWQSISVNVQAGHAAKSQFYTVVAPSGKKHTPPNGRCWAYNEERMLKEIELGNIWFGSDGQGVPRRKKFMYEGKQGLTPETLWLADEVSTTKAAKKQILKLFKDEPVFDTPKPEQLIHKILSIASNEGELILDAYLGSGTTAAVAHKMKRKYIGIEQGEHAVSHCADRLRRVIDGESSGVSKLADWEGGGGFKFLTLNT
ncbi:site-specific DNA-methyltransferase [Pseudoalteromonas agarivorans]|uniref:site-specific DNA-methyltransferase n=1 Tax=Pseudoalteromonas agarivorans TaxID=176102 RepID=UPI00311F861E